MGQNVTAIYRVHEEPDERRLQEYREEVLSHHVPCGNLTKRPEVQKLLQKLDTIPIGAALKIGFLRSLMRARYAVEPLGHYGLAKNKYTHFTSPIRRYADLVVHRALFQTSHGPAHSLKETADHISDTERNSADAERDSKDVKLYAFLKAQLRVAETDAVSGAGDRRAQLRFLRGRAGPRDERAGASVQPAGRLLSCSTTERSQLIGRRNRRVIRLGDKVQVQVAKVDSFKKQVDFRLARDGDDGSARPPRRREPEQKPRWTRASRQRRHFGGNGRRQ